MKKTRFSKFLEKVFSHYLIYPEWSKLHYALKDLVFSIIKPHFSPIKRCIIAPRGFGKSVFISLILPILAILMGNKKYVLIISYSRDKAASFVKNIKDELEQNTLLKEIFNYEKGKFWSSLELDIDMPHQPTASIKALGIGSNIRGERKGSQRPDLIILDDVESREVAFSRERSEKLWQWFTSDVIPAGDELMTDYAIVGTTITDLSFVNRIEQTPTFQTLRFRAIEEIYDYEFIQEFEHILKNQNLEEATKFYHDNRERAEKAAKLLWANVWDLLTLLLKKAEIGSSAFEAEYQQNAEGLSLKIFEISNYKRISQKEFRSLLRANSGKIRFGIGYDPTTGKESKKGCLAGIVVLAKIQNTIYIAESKGIAKTIEEQINTVIKLARKYRKYGEVSLYVEANHLQHILADRLKQRLKNLPVHKIENTRNKIDRIISLQPAFETGNLVLVGNQPELENELEDFPNSRYVDVIDALELAYRHIKADPVVKLVDRTRREFSPFWDSVKSYDKLIHKKTRKYNWKSTYRE